jgi:phosphoribosyl 1,2-cyclic phosphate phosphodiesterase
MPIDIYGNESVNSYAGDFENVKDVIKFNEICAFETINISGYVITPLKADHDPSQSCFIYIIEEIKDDINSGKKILYGNDTGYFPEETWDYLLKNHTGSNKFDFVSLDTTAIILDWRQGHMGIDCCRDVRDRLAEMGAADDKTVFCFHHFSHNGAKTYDELVPIAKDMGFIVSYDGMEIKI